jgi:uroporphyrin-III C-methyltransferase/precorrin-2 dehydrogenase/sirohydrochlorin ferrochelatase
MAGACAVNAVPPATRRDHAATIDVMYPLFLRLAGRPVLVVGGGQVAARRVQRLVADGALVTVVAPQPDPELTARGDIELHQRPFDPADVQGMWLVQACAPAEVNADVVQACEQQRIWCVDAASAGTSPAWTGSVVTGPDGVVVAVSGGGDPGRAKLLQAELTRALSRIDLRPQRPGGGAVALVGAGPGDPDLLTVRARDLLAAADVVVADRLAPRAALDLTHGRIVHVGKSPGDHTVGQDDINEILVAEAAAGHRVVRLKGGDPFVLGRGGEELAACLAAGIDVEVVPGITSAVAVPGAAGIPVTHRGMATGFLVATAHGEDPGLVAHLAQIPPEITIVLLMGVRSLQMVVDVLLTQREPDTPAAIVERGWTPEQRTVSATLATVVQAASDAGVRAPSIVVIGAVAALHEQFGDVARLSDGAGLIAD